MENIPLQENPKMENVTIQENPKMENIPLQEMCKLGFVGKTRIQNHKSNYNFHSTTFFRSKVLFLNLKTHYIPNNKQH